MSSPLLVWLIKNRTSIWLVTLLKTANSLSAGVFLLCHIMNALNIRGFSNIFAYVLLPALNIPFYSTHDTVALMTSFFNSLLLGLIISLEVVRSPVAHFGRQRGFGDSIF